MIELALRPSAVEDARAEEVVTAEEITLDREVVRAEEDMPFTGHM